MMTAVIGIATTSLRNGRCHAVRSISSSTSRPSRKRITTSAVIGEDLDEAGARVQLEHTEAASAEEEADQHEDRGQREEAAMHERRDERTEHEQTAEQRGDGLEVGHWLHDA